MTYLCIQNSGEVEPEAFTLLGASVKEDEAIGFFGSGNKYAIACIIRAGLELRIFSGEREILIERVQKTFRGETFEVLKIAGEMTSITTNTGPKWHVRDAVREFYCNALDEKDGHKFMTSEVTGNKNTTRVFIQINDEISEMLGNWDIYFLSKDLISLHSDMEGEIYDHHPVNYYRKGVWICEDRSVISRFTYNFNNINLPESRKISSAAAANKITAILMRCTSEKVWNTILEAADDLTCIHEYQSFRYWYIANETLNKCFNDRYDVIAQVRNRDKLENKTNYRILWCGDNQYSALSYQNFKKLEDIMKSSDFYTTEPWPIGYKTKVLVELAVLATVDIHLKESNIKFGTFSDAGMLAFCDISNRLIILGERCFSENCLRKALIEEWTHYEYHVTDGSVEQQHVYLNLIDRLIGPREKPEIIELF